MRYLKYLPIIIPLVQRFLRSPQVKSAISKARASQAKGGSRSSKSGRRRP